MLNPIASAVALIVSPFLALLIIPISILINLNFFSPSHSTLLATGIKTFDPQDAELYPEESSPSPSPDTSLTPLIERPLVGMPISIQISAINLSADIEPVGVTPENVMEVPQNGANVGWFTPEERPGEIGGAILSGHYDTPSGRPAVFARLRQLKQGDDVIIITDKGETFNFRVRTLVNETYQLLPSKLIYEDYNEPKLILITCDGIWDPVKSTYSNRLVVYANLWTQETQPQL